MGGPSGLWEERMTIGEQCDQDFVIVTPKGGESAELIGTKRGTETYFGYRNVEPYGAVTVEKPGEFIKKSKQQTLHV